MGKSENSGFFRTVAVSDLKLIMLRLHLPRASNDLFVYVFPYGFQVS